MKTWQEIISEKKLSKKEIQKAFDKNMELFEDTTDGREECYEKTADQLGLTVDAVKKVAW